MSIRKFNSIHRLPRQSAVFGSDNRPDSRLFRHDRFKWTLVSSVVFHLFIVLGVSFVMPRPLENNVYSPPLNIILVSGRSDDRPDDTATFAPVNSRSEGNGGLSIPVVAQTQEDIPHGANAEAFLYAQQNAELLKNRQRNREKNIRANRTGKQLKETINLAYLNAQSRPREKYVSARSKEHKYAAYIEKWRILVERVGNLNYPDAARQQGLVGSLILDAAIRSDGTVEKIRVLDSSGFKVLDDSAGRIVHIAAPFAPFPNEIKSEIDILHIVNTWNFDNGKVTSEEWDTQ